jgi:NAD+ synthase (glutamine-hydrolysing)
MNKGFIRVAAAIPELRVADCAYNVSKIGELVRRSETEKTQIVCFPELSVTGYTCADLFQQQQLLADAEKALYELQMLTFPTTSVVIVGMPIRFQHQLFNTAVVLQGGQILGIVPKTHIPNQNEFYEKRWFASGASISGQSILLAGKEVPFGTDLLFLMVNFRLPLKYAKIFGCRFLRVHNTVCMVRM